MERENKTIITPVDKHEVVFLSWLTGGEKREITNSFLDNQDLQITGDSQKFKVNSEVINNAQDITFQTVIVSINGQTEDIVKNILNMKSKDFDFIVDAINLVTNDEEVKKK